MKSLFIKSVCMKSICLKSMRRFSVLILLFLTSFINAADKHRQLAIEYLEVSNQEAVLNITIDSMVNEITLQNPKANPQEVRSFFESYMGWEVLKNSMVDIAVNHLTIKQLQDIIRFYKTESGKVFADKTVDMTVDLTKIMALNMPTMQGPGF